MSDFRLHWLGWLAIPMYGKDYSLFTWMIVPGFTFLGFFCVDVLLRGTVLGWRTGRPWAILLENALLSLLVFNLKDRLGLAFSTGDSLGIFFLALVLKLALQAASLGISALSRRGSAAPPPPRLASAVTLRSFGAALMAIYLEADKPDFLMLDHVLGTLIFWDMAAWLGLIACHRGAVAVGFRLGLWTGSPLTMPVEAVALVAIIVGTAMIGFFPDERHEFGLFLWFLLLRVGVMAVSLGLQRYFDPRRDHTVPAAVAVFVLARATVSACSCLLLWHYLL